MRNRRLLTIALTTSSLVAVGGIAFAVVQSVDPTPAPQVVIPASSSSTTGRASATPEPGDDRGRDAVGRHDDPATHDAGDDNGGTSSTDSSGSDDPATHDAGDDNGGTSASGTDSSGSDDSTSAGSDDSGRSGSDDSGSGGSGGGHGSDG